jgi:RND family efflux transporter MFP subunit
MKARATIASVCAWACLAGACRHDNSTSSAAHPQAETLDVTDWTDKTELYMEYPPLVAGQAVKFAVHLTTLADFKALNAGRAAIEFIPEAGGPPTRLEGTGPLRPGAFRVEGTPPAAGRYAWALIVDAPGLADRHDLGVIAIFPDEKSVQAEAGKPPLADAAAIPYLKEQQWTNEFSTVQVTEAELRSSIRVPAVIDALTGGEAIVSAPVAGRFMADELASIGDTVRAGQPLGRLEPRLASTEDRASLAASVAELQAQLDTARADQVRAESLFAERAVPARRVEEARRATVVAETRLGAAQVRLAQRDETLRTGGGSAAGNAFVLPAPISGRIADVKATLGASYDEGVPLFRIVRTDEVELRADVPAPDVPLVRNIRSIAFEIPGRPDPVILAPHHMHDAGVLNPETKALPLQFEVKNPRGQLLVGQAGTALLFGDRTERMPVLPAAAVLMEAGRPYVFVQVGGERFVRRPIEIAVHDSDRVGIRSGIKPGERVVLRGAYDVHLASAAKGLPAEGHVH